MRSTLTPRQAHEAARHLPGNVERDAETLQTVRYVAVAEFFANAGKSDEGHGPAETAADAEGHAFAEVVLPFDHEQRAAENRAIHGNERQEDTERVIERRHEPIEQHLEDLYECRDDANVRHEPEKTQVDTGEARPAERAFFQQVGIDQVIDRHRDRLDHHNGDTEPDRGIDALRYREEGAHAEEERQREVLDERGTDEQVEIEFHQSTSVR